MAKEVKPEIKRGEIRIENVVASSTLGVDIDLEKVAVSLKNIEYEPEQFPGLVFHLDRPKTAALIFGSGKIVRSEEHTSELQSHSFISYAVFCLKKKKQNIKKKKTI